MRDSAFCWRAACFRRGGNPPAPAFPRRGKRERGRPNSLLPQAEFFRSLPIPRFHPNSIALADIFGFRGSSLISSTCPLSVPPCFHTHSWLNSASSVPDWYSIGPGAAISEYRPTSGLSCPTGSAATAQSPGYRRRQKLDERLSAQFLRDRCSASLIAFAAQLLRRLRQLPLWFIALTADPQPVQ